MSPLPSLSAVTLALALAFAGPGNPAFADLLPPGHRSISHKLVFEDSPLLQSHRLIATPVRGFGGYTEVKAGEPFSFSTKYGTRLYVVPEDYRPPEKSVPGEPLPFPSSEVPVRCVTSVPVISPVKSIVSTCKLTKVGEHAIEVVLVDHVELGSDGQPASLARHAFLWAAIAAAGFLGCLLIWSRRRGGQRESSLESNEATAASP